MKKEKQTSDDKSIKKIDDGKDSKRRAELKDFLEKVPEEILTEALIGKIHDEPKDLKRVIKAASFSEHFSGPIPPPKILNQYEGVHEGLANRIVSMAEKEQGHRHDLESTALSGEIKKDSRGQNYALFTSLSIIIGSIFLIYSGHEVSGSILVGSTLMGLAYIFITGRKLEPDKKSDKEILEKNPSIKSIKDEA
ncbi:MAG: DUF2335 domain-containing protein [Pseudomonadota bacterium]